MQYARKLMHCTRTLNAPAKTRRNKSDMSLRGILHNEHHGSFSFRPDLGAWLYEPRTVQVGR